MRCNNLLGLLALLVLNQLLAAVASAGLEAHQLPWVARNGSSITSPEGRLNPSSNSAPSPPRILATVMAKNFTLMYPLNRTLTTANLTKGDIITLMTQKDEPLAVPVVLSGSTLEVKGALVLARPKNCTSSKGVPVVPRGSGLALSRSNTLMYACTAPSINVTEIWAQTNLTSGTLTAQLDFNGWAAGFLPELSARSFVIAANGTSWAMANTDIYEGSPASFLVNLDPTMDVVDSETSLLYVKPAQHALSLDAAPHNEWFEFASGGPEVYTLSTWNFVAGINVADLPDHECTAVLPMPDGTTIIGCAGPGNSTGRICAYHIIGGKALSPLRNKVLHKWCVPDSKPQVPLPPGLGKRTNLSAEVFLALSADRQSFLLTFNDYYQEKISRTPPNANLLAAATCYPKAFRVNLAGPSAWQQAASSMLCSQSPQGDYKLGAGAMVVFGGMPVSEQDCGTGSCCSPLGTFLPNTTKCREAGDDPCLEDAYCTGSNAGCPVLYAEDFTPCSKAPRGLFTAVSGFSGATSPASVISSSEAALKNYKKCHLCYKGRCLKTTLIRKSKERRRGDYGAGEEEEDWVYCV